MNESIQEIAKKMVAPGKGILAADESTGTIKKRFDAIGAESTEETRRFYREMLFTSVGIGDYISGVILFDETIRQSTADGKPFPKLLEESGIISGIKVDMKAHSLAGSIEEKITEGLDGLRERLKEYYELGARFAKWRAVLNIDTSKDYPSDYCIHVNAHALARYTVLCQEAGIVPIVEPEVLMDGGHSIDDCYMATKKTLQKVFDELKTQGVELDGIILKPNMVIDGKEFEPKSSPDKIAEMTVKCFRETVPENVPGIVFLSGGQSEAEACVNLNAMNKDAQKHPWELSFSYGRALQASALQAWAGKEENRQTAQDTFLHRAKLTSAARSGVYSLEMENKN
jgi:fructose-bisphosphate aldolase, class I